VEEVAVMWPVVAMAEVGVMVEAVVVLVLVVLVLVVVAIIHMVAHMEAEGLHIQEEAMGEMVGGAMVDMVDQDMGMVQEVPMEETPSMEEEEEADLADRFHGVMMVTVLGR
jgi:hypothetical protein